MFFAKSQPNLKILKHKTTNWEHKDLQGIMIELDAFKSIMSTKLEILNLKNRNYNLPWEEWKVHYREEKLLNNN